MIGPGSFQQSSFSPASTARNSGENKTSGGGPAFGQGVTRTYSSSCFWDLRLLVWSVPFQRFFSHLQIDRLTMSAHTPGITGPPSSGGSIHPPETTSEA